MLLSLLNWIYVGLEQFIGTGCFLPTVIVFLEYGLAVASSTYCLTFFFSDHTMAQVGNFSFSLCILSSREFRLNFRADYCFNYLQNVVLLVNFFTGLILMAISFIMGLIKTTESANSFLKVELLSMYPNIWQLWKCKINGISRHKCKSICLSSSKFIIEHRFCLDV